MDVVLGGARHTTKKTITAYAQKIKKVIGVVYPKGTPEFCFLLDLLQTGHLCAKTKIGIGVREFYVEDNGKGITRFTIRREDNTTEHFSYLKCIRYLDVLTDDAKAKESWNKLRGVCRRLVLEDINNFRRQTKPSVCAICGTPYPHYRLHVHHSGPTFLELLLSFNQERDDVPVDFDNVPLADADYRSSTHEFKRVDDRYARAFRIYHQQHANLQLLCPPCHLQLPHNKPINGYASIRERKG